MASGHINIGAAVDLGLASVIAGAFLQVLPPIAAVLAILWYAIQLYESTTVQTWLRNHRQRHAVRRLKRLEAKQKVILAEIAATELLRRASVIATETREMAKADAATLVAQQKEPDL